MSCGVEYELMEEGRGRITEERSIERVWGAWGGGRRLSRTGQDQVSFEAGRGGETSGYRLRARCVVAEQRSPERAVVDPRTRNRNYVNMRRFVSIVRLDIGGPSTSRGVRGPQGRYPRQGHLGTVLHDHKYGQTSSVSLTLVLLEQKLQV